jgi:hypothetical protein
MPCFGSEENLERMRNEETSGSTKTSSLTGQELVQGCKKSFPWCKEENKRKEKRKMGGEMTKKPQAQYTKSKRERGVLVFLENRNGPLISVDPLTSPSLKPNPIWALKIHY